MLAQLRGSALDGAGDTLLKRNGMNSVEHEKSADERIAAEFGERRATSFGCAEHLNDARYDRAVHVHYGLQKIERGSSRVSVGKVADALDHLLDSCGMRLEIAG
jgi:hypothetical protein